MVLTLIRCLAGELTCPVAPAAITVLIWLTMFSLTNQAVANDCCLWVIWTPSSLPTGRSKTIAEEGDRVSGPGATDMQGGQVVMLNALKALDAKGLLEDMTVTVQLNGDEEMGSLSSSKYLEEQVALHDYGLAYEFNGTNNLLSVRKGLGQARYVVNGKASHAGGAH